MYFVFSAGCAFNVFLQSNYIIKSNGFKLNLVFTNLKKLFIAKATKTLVPFDLFYPSLYLTYFSVHITSKFVIKHKFFKFHKRQYNEINYFLSSYNWVNTFSLLNLNPANCAIFNALNFSIIKFILK